MTYEIPGQQVPKESAGDNSLNQYRGMVLDANGRVALAGAAVRITGILQNKPGALGRAATIMVNGISKACAGAPIAAGARLMTDGTGRFITATGTNPVVGECEEAAVNTGDLFPMRLIEN